MVEPKKETKIKNKNTTMYASVALAQERKCTLSHQCVYRELKVEKAMAPKAASYAKIVKGSMAQEPGFASGSADGNTPPLAASSGEYLQGATQGYPKGSGAGGNTPPTAQKGSSRRRQVLYEDKTGGVHL